MVGHQTTAFTQWSQDSPVPSDTDDYSVPVSVEATPSSTIADHTVDQPAGAGNHSSPAHCLQHMFVETVLLGSDDEDEEVKFDYGAETLPCSSTDLSKSQHTCFVSSSGSMWLSRRSSCLFTVMSPVWLHQGFSLGCGCSFQDVSDNILGLLSICWIFVLSSLYCHISTCLHSCSSGWSAPTCSCTRNPFYSGSNANCCWW